MHAPVPLPHAGVHEMHDADVTKGRCSRIDSPPRSYYADVIWPANTLPGSYSPSDCHSSSVRVSAFPFFSPVNLVFALLSLSSINTELIPEMSIVLCGCVRPRSLLTVSLSAAVFRRRKVSLYLFSESILILSGTVLRVTTSDAHLPRMNFRVTTRLRQFYSPVNGEP